MIYGLSVSLLFLLLLLLIVVYSSYFSNVSKFSEDLRVWSNSFECGFLSQGPMESYFSFSYFLMLVFFVLFDLEVSLLLNVPFQGVLFKNFWFYVFFLGCLCLGYSAEVEGGYVGWLH